MQTARENGAKASVQIAARKELDQKKEALAAAKAAVDVEAAEERKAAALDNSSKRIAEAERKRAKAHADATAFAIAKFELLISAAVAAARAVTTAISGTVADFDRLYYVSGRTGSSVSSLKALGYAFEQTGSSAHDAISAVESFTQAMRSNPGARQFVDNLGIDKSLGGVERLTAAVDKLNERHEPYIAQQYATGILGLSVEQYNQFTLQGKEMKRLLEQRREFAKSIGLDEQQGADASKRFSQALGEISMMAEVTFQRVLIDVLPRLTGWIDKARDWLREHQKDIKEWVDWAEEKISGFATAIQQYFKEGAANGFSDLFGEELGQKFDRFNERLAKLADSLKAIAGFVRTLAPYFKELFGREAVPGLGTGVTAYQDFGHRVFGEGVGSGSSAPVDNRRWYEKILPKGWGGKDAPSGPVPEGGGRMGRAQQSANARIVMEEFKAAGLPAEGVAALMGSGQTESGFNPRAHNDVSGGHTGLLQWDRTRWAKVSAWIKAQGGDPFDIRWQARAAIAEGRAKPGDALYDSGTTARGFRKLEQSAGDLGKAMDGIKDIERYGDGEESGRGANARAWLPHVNAPTPPTSAVPSPPPAAGMRGLPNMTPGGFDPNRISPQNAMQPAPAGASPVTNNNTSSTSRAVTQNITNNVKVDGSTAPREQGRIMQSSLDAVHALALANAQSAVG